MATSVNNTMSSAQLEAAIIEINYNIDKYERKGNQAQADGYRSLLVKAQQYLVQAREREAQSSGGGGSGGGGSGGGGSGGGNGGGGGREEYNKEWSQLGLDDKIKNLQARMSVIRSQMGLGGITDWNYSQQLRNINMELQGLLQQQAAQRISEIQSEREKQAKEIMSGYAPSEEKPMINSQPQGPVFTSPVIQNPGQNQSGPIFTQPVIRKPNKPQGPVVTNPVILPPQQGQGPVMFPFQKPKPAIGSYINEYSSWFPKRLPNGTISWQDLQILKGKKPIPSMA